MLWKKDRQVVQGDLSFPGNASHKHEAGVDTGREWEGGGCVTFLFLRKNKKPLLLAIFLCISGNHKSFLNPLFFPEFSPSLLSLPFPSPSPLSSSLLPLLAVSVLSLTPVFYSVHFSLYFHFFFPFVPLFSWHLYYLRKYSKEQWFPKENHNLVEFDQTWRKRHWGALCSLQRNKNSIRELQLHCFHLTAL